MKNLKLIFTITLLAIFTLSGCANESDQEKGNTIESSSADNSSIKSDAKRLVDLQCQVMKLIGEAKNGDATALMKSEEINKQAEKVSRELKEKYPTKEDQERFAEAYQEALGECE
ncbi:hypothetical protein ERX46_00370 [Brumimicrobium glaciale]|uniref:Uncharacterized protein n=1 Tax=Brumimicrobium glaciale TaxID=200475 RepID=A0A4Q4KS52_9FLAO|nr:hypothetical protein [Brumimicrobium glaciale]RYM35479.1 hypothetical protein ERX46_00370 [Brumimicrobium glaciale]